jgi:heme-degrading monooxygenase HmoA
MLLVRDVFRCKPGKSRQVAEMFKKAIPSMEKMDGFRSPRVMLDFVAEYWTVVLESEVDSLGRFEEHMASFGSRPEVREALAGYMDLVEGGSREIYKIV